MTIYSNARLSHNNTFRPVILNEDECQTPGCYDNDQGEDLIGNGGPNIPVGKGQNGPILGTSGDGPSSPNNDSAPTFREAIYRLIDAIRGPQLVPALG